MAVDPKIGIKMKQNELTKKFMIILNRKFWFIEKYFSAPFISTCSTEDTFIQRLTDAGVLCSSTEDVLKQDQTAPRGGRVIILSNLPGTAPLNDLSAAPVIC